ncbi:hypothetical protein [Candidatus Neptunochlamydia vexilliferae]|uniref:hypothetical protein n=1 Tax=Candidatus Neptunichlamydia vexilliferae TaxID=1651774 RepID=UPI0018919B2D|nr:hypothetical protein [Candidatus Neptunochlamydia vexilliferae]
MAVENPILSWDQNTLTQKITTCGENQRQFELIALVTRIALCAFGLAVMVAFGRVKPIYFILSATLLIVAYVPAMEVSVDQILLWAEAAAKEAAQYRAIQGELDKGTVEGLNEVLSAQFRVLKAKDEPEHGEGVIRQRVENLRNKVRQAYLYHVYANKTDARKIADFGTFNRYHINDLIECEKFAVFTKTGREFTNLEVEQTKAQELAKSIFS